MARILWVTTIPATAGFVLPLAARLAERGNYVQLACGAGEHLELLLSHLPVSLVSLRRNPLAPGNLRAVIELYRLIKRGHFDIVHSYTPVGGVVGRIAARIAGVPVIIHSVLGSFLVEEVPAWQRFLYLASERMLGRWTDLFITLNDADSTDLVTYHIAPETKAASLRYEFGVDLTRLDPDRLDKARLEVLRCEFGLTPGLPVLGFIGRLVGDKGILDLFEAFRILRNRGHAAQLLFVGALLATDRDQESLEELKRRITEQGLESSVIFTGYRQDIPDLIALMDIVILPSHREGFPRIPVEAAAMGKPAITTATRGHEVAVVDGTTGLVVPIADPARLAQAMETLIRDPALAQQMGRSGLARTRELFDERKIVDAQMALYQRAVQDSGIAL